jgi:hypothetical protein
VLTEPYLFRQGQHVVPTPIAQGPWGGTVSGHVVGGLVASALEVVGHDPDFQPARLTVDLLRPVALEPIEVTAELSRAGGRIRLADATLTQRGKLVGRASAVFLRRSEQPDQEVWSRPAAIPPAPSGPPTGAERSPFQLRAYGWGPAAPRKQDPQQVVPKSAWVCETRPLFTGEVLSPFTRAAMAGDITSTVTHWGSGGMRYINADYTLTLSRLPDGDYVGISAESHLSHAGVATGVATVFDAGGPIGYAMATAHADQRFRSPF